MATTHSARQLMRGDTAGDYVVDAFERFTIKLSVRVLQNI